jgi:murein DD-endopeptidase MepM/ murein hydrolase activator NlpD
MASDDRLPLALLLTVFILAASSFLYRPVGVRVEKEYVFTEHVIETEAANVFSSLRPPVDTARLTSRMGVRRSPMGGGSTSFHPGVDLVTVEDGHILAAGDGVVVENWPAPNGFFKGHPVFGGMVVLYHGNGIYTQYGHLKSVWVRTGQEVTAGQALGIQGNTGISTGDHLHFELRVDPAYFIPGWKW